MAGNKIMAVVVMCIVVISTMQVKETAADSGVYKTCFEKCIKNCLEAKKENVVCDMKCDTECDAAELADRIAKLSKK